MFSCPSINRIFCFVLAFLLIHGFVQTQEPIIVYAGEAIRVIYKCEGDKGINRVYQGKVLAFEGNLLHLKDINSDEQKIVQWDCMKRWYYGEEKFSRKRGILNGAVIGLLAGGFIGAGLDPAGSYGVFGGGTSTGSAIGMTVGLFGGTAIGYLTSKNRVWYNWQYMGSNQIRIELKSVNDTIGIGLVCTF